MRDRELARRPQTTAGSTISETRDNEDFAQHIGQTIATDPQAGGVFVVENLLKLSVLFLSRQGHSKKAQHFSAGMTGQRAF